VQFGLALPHYDFSVPGESPLRFETIAAHASAAEALGFDSLWVSDHVSLSIERYGGPPGEQFAYEPLATLAALSGVPRRRRRPAAEGALERVGAAKLCGRLVGRLSKGQRQRVALAGAIVHGPDVLLLDEPSEGLDPRQMVALRTLLAELKAKASIVFSTHLLAEAQAVCDRVVVIDQGKIVLERAAGGMDANRLRVMVGGADAHAVRAALAAVPGVVGVDGEICTVAGPAAAEAIAAEVCGRGWRLRHLAPVPDDLEAAFLAAVSGTPPTPGVTGSTPAS